MAQPVLKCQHLGIQFGGLKAVDDFNMEIGESELVGLIGPNGAGKTPVFNLITGVYKPTEGSLYLNGERLPQGYNTMVSCDGANLSQGQRQLLAIARAAVADPPVLILDEATSSIDTRTEALIEKGMDRLMEGRTVFVIAHRLSTVRNSNAIIVLEHGGIVERGSHDELLAQKGEYYQLYNGMFELA